MAPRVTAKEWADRAVAKLTLEAQEIGLLGQDEYLLYVPYSKKDGTEASITAWNQFGPRPRNFWQPTVDPKDSHRIVERLADAQSKLLYSLKLQLAFVKAMDAQD